MIMFGSFLPSLGRCHYQVYSGRGSRRFYEITGLTSATRRGLTVEAAPGLQRPDSQGLGGDVRPTDKTKLWGLIRSSVGFAVDAPLGTTFGPPGRNRDKPWIPRLIWKIWRPPLRRSYSISHPLCRGCLTLIAEGK